jgi:hypothetical protein
VVSSIVRALIATFLAPLVAALIVAAIFSIQLNLGAGIYAFIMAYVVSLLSEVVIGLPLVYLGWRLSIIRWWTAALGGFLVGALAAVAMQWSHSPSPGILGGFGAIGAISGLAFWLIWRAGSGAGVATAPSRG